MTQKTNSPKQAPQNPLKAEQNHRSKTLLKVAYFTGLLAMGVGFTLSFLMVFFDAMKKTGNGAHGSFSTSVLCVAMILIPAGVLAVLKMRKSLSERVDEVKTSGERIESIREDMSAQGGAMSLSLDASVDGALSQHNFALDGDLSQAESNVAFDFEAEEETANTTQTHSETQRH